MPSNKNKRRKPTKAELEVIRKVAVNILKTSEYWCDYWDDRNELNIAETNPLVPVDAVKLARKDLKGRLN